MNFLKYFLVILFFLVSCQGEERSRRDRRFRQANEERENRDFLNRDRSAELRRLRGDRGDTIIQSNLEERYEGISYKDYEGRDCKTSKECIQLCDDIVSYGRRNRCYNSPQGLVEDLEDGLFQLLSISNIESVSISPNLLAGIFYIDEELLDDIVEEEMSVGDLRSFLAWVAINSDISQVFKKEDRSSDILKTAFERLAENEEGVSKGKGLETGLNLGLIQDEDSFFYLSAAEDNEFGFEIAYKLLRSSCGSKDCKLRVFCAREKLNSNRSRVFGYQNTQFCRTLSKPNRRIGQEVRSNRNPQVDFNQRIRFSSRDTCYIHSAVAWGFLDELIDDEDIKDNDFENDSITVEKCNDFCGNDRANTKCDRIL